MALTIRISNVDDVIAAFAKNDIMISHMTKLRAAESEFTKGMAPGDDYYTSPFAVSSGWTRKTASRPKAQVIQILLHCLQVPRGARSCHPCHGRPGARHARTWLDG